MLFRYYFFLPGVKCDKTKIKLMLQRIDPEMKETQKPSGSSTLYIGSESEVLERFGSQQYTVTPIYIEDICSEQQSGFPLEKMRQMASNCFYKHNVTLVSFDNTTAVDLVKRIELLGGKISPKITSETTILVAESAFSKKTFAALESGLPVVSKKWIIDSFNSLTCYDYRRFYLPPFAGYTVTSSDLLPDEQKQLAKTIVEGGGKWQENFNDEVQIVLASYLSSTTKIEIALASNVPVIKPDWVMECARRPVPPTSYCLNFWAFDDQKSDIFTNITFSIHQDVRNSPSLVDAVTANGGKFGRSPTHVIVPPGYDVSKLESTANAVTARWVWDCISQRRLLGLSGSILYRPLCFVPPLNELEGRTFSLIDLDEGARRTAAEAVRILGGRVSYRFTKNASFVVTAGEAAATHAQRRGIPSVSPLFLIQILRNGIVPRPSSYPAFSEATLTKLCSALLKTGKRDSGSEYVLKADIIDFTQAAASQEGDVEIDEAVRPIPRLAFDPLLEALGGDSALMSSL